MALEDNLEKEKISLSTKVVIGIGILALLASIGFGIKYIYDNNLIEKAVQKLIYSPYRR